MRAYIETTPADPAVKYGIDEASGYPRVGRPPYTSLLPPMPHGFIPRTRCGPAVARLGGEVAEGDGEALDICVLSEQPIGKSEVLVPAKVIGGLRMIDRGRTDDKIAAVLENDVLWTVLADIAALPRPLVDRLRQYFATYKRAPEAAGTAELGVTYGREHALEVVRASIADYATWQTGQRV